MIEFTPAVLATTVLQVSTETGTLRVAAVLGSFVVSVVLGLLIARKAFHGYVATRSKPMFYLAIGIVLLTAVPAVLSTVLTNFTATPPFAVVLATNASEITGLLAIAYSLYGNFGSGTGPSGQRNG